MKRFYWIFALITGIIGLILFATNGKKIAPPKLAKEQMHQDYYEQEWLKTRDLSTNEIPKERLLDAIAYSNKLKEEKKLLRSEFGIPNMDWAERGPNNIGGRARAAIFDLNDPSGNTVWAGSVGGGLWKTNAIQANEPNWALINHDWENIAITAIAQAKNSPNILYVGTGEGWGNSDAIRGLGIWKSSDAGTTWTRLASTATGDFYYINKIEIDQNGTVFVATKTGIFRSTDQGTTWSKVYSENITDLEISSNGIYYMAVKGLGVYKSSTGLSGSWSRLSGINYVGAGRIEFAIAPSDPNYIYVLLAAASGGTCKDIYVTSNGGTSWIRKAPPSAVGMTNFCRNQAWYDLAVGIDLLNPSIVYIGGVDCLKSTNEGDSWIQISNWTGSTRYMHADQHLILNHPTMPNRMLFANDGGIFLTEEAQQTLPPITNKITGFNVTQYYACAVHPKAGVDTMLAGAQDNGSTLFFSLGINSARKVTGGDGAYCHIDQDEPWIQISSYVYNSYYITKNNWGSYSNIHIGSSAGSFINATDYDDKNNILYCNYNAGYLARIKNIGRFSQDYDTIAIPGISSSEISAIKVSPNVENRIYVGLYNGYIYMIDNANGSSLRATRILTSSGVVSSIDIQTGDENHILATCSNYGTTNVRESNNGGQNWTILDGNLPDMPVRWGLFSPADPTQALLATEIGVWTTAKLDNTNTKWSPADSGMPNTRVDMLQARAADNLIAAATHGRGLFTTFAKRIPSEFILKDFTATDKYTYILLDWNTSIEKGAARIEVEKSLDGTTFSKIGEKAAKYIPDGGNYNFQDPNYQGDIHYYRLKLIDIYGEFKYSNVVVIKIRKLNEGPNFFPNPVHEYLTVQSKNYVFYNAKLLFFDFAGKKILEVPIPNGLSANAFFEVDLRNLPSAAYIYQLWNNGSKVSSTKLVKL